MEFKRKIAENYTKHLKWCPIHSPVEFEIKTPFERESQYIMVLAIGVSLQEVRTFKSQVLQTEKKTQSHKRNLRRVPGSANIMIKIATVKREVLNESLLSPSSSDQNLFILMYFHCHSVSCSSLINILFYHHSCNQLLLWQTAEYQSEPGIASNSPS